MVVATTAATNGSTAEGGDKTTAQTTTATAPPVAARFVTITATATVLPVNKPAVAKCPLATFDLPYITFYYNQKLLLYKFEAAGAGADVDQFEAAVAKMRSALGEALGWFYPLAGRIAQDEEGVLLVECDGEGLLGAEVVEAAAEGVQVAELAKGGGSHEDDAAEKMMQELVPYTGVMNLEGLRRPLMAVQFTKLKDGLAVGCAFNHAILDGNSTWHFMSSWAELSRGAAAPSLLPLHDRAAARAVRVPLNLPTSPDAHEKLDPNGPPKPLVARLFSFPEPLVDRIKSAANAALAHAPDAKPFSTFQSLGAHIWRAVARARGLAPDEITVFAIFTDCRPRVDPPHPPAYFGNLIQAIFTGIPAGMLLAGPPELGAGLLQKVINEHDAAAIVQRLEGYEAAPKLFYYSDAGVNCVAVGSSPRFRVYDVDFGFGRPERVRSGSNNKFDGMVYLYPGRDGGRSIDVELTLQPEAMKKLEVDEDFLPAAAA